MGSNFERTMEMERGNFAGNFAGSLGGTGGPAAGVARKACQIFVRNVSSLLPICVDLICDLLTSVTIFNIGCC